MAMYVQASKIQGWIIVGLMAAVLILGVLPQASVAQEEVVLNNGKAEYLGYCTVCHGTNGKGDGPMAELLVTKPRDLTQIRKQNDGRFPFWHLYRVIDGREEVRAHGVRAMPVWGAHFLIEEGGQPLDEQLVIGRILGLVYYLRSIQEQ